MAGLVLIESAVESLLPHPTDEQADSAADGSPLPSMGDLPLVVMTIDTQEYVLPPMTGASPEESLNVWPASQAQLVSLSRRGQQLWVKNAGHYSILHTHADEVVRAITLTISEART